MLPWQLFPVARSILLHITPVKAYMLYILFIVCLADFYLFYQIPQPLYTLLMIVYENQLFVGRLIACL